MDERKGCQCCTYCKKCQGSDFQKILHLKDTGLVIYKYKISHADQAVLDDVFIIHNTKNTDVPQEVFVPEFEQQKEVCPKCKHLIDRTEKVLASIKSINKNEIKSVCEHCRKKLEPLKLPCEKCEDAANRFISTIGKLFEYPKTKTELKSWMDEQHLLKHFFGEPPGERCEFQSEMFPSDIRKQSELDLLPGSIDIETNYETTKRQLDMLRKENPELFKKMQQQHPDLFSGRAPEDFHTLQLQLGIIKADHGDVIEKMQQKHPHLFVPKSEYERIQRQLDKLKDDNPAIFKKLQQQYPDLFSSTSGIKDFHKLKQQFEFIKTEYPNEYAKMQQKYPQLFIPKSEYNKTKLQLNKFREDNPELFSNLQKQYPDVFSSLDDVQKLQKQLDFIKTKYPKEFEKMVQKQPQLFAPKLEHDNTKRQLDKLREENPELFANLQRQYPEIFSGRGLEDVHKLQKQLDFIKHKYPKEFEKMEQKHPELFTTKSEYIKKREIDEKFDTSQPDHANTKRLLDKFKHENPEMFSKLQRQFPDLFSAKEGPVDFEKLQQQLEFIKSKHPKEMGKIQQMSKEEETKKQEKELIPLYRKEDKQAMKKEKDADKEKVGGAEREKAKGIETEKVKGTQKEKQTSTGKEMGRDAVKENTKGTEKQKSGGEKEKTKSADKKKDEGIVKEKAGKEKTGSAVREKSKKADDETDRNVSKKARGSDKEAGKGSAKDKARSFDKEEGIGVVKEKGRGSDKEEAKGGAKGKAKGFDKEEGKAGAKEKNKNSDKEDVIGVVKEKGRGSDKEDAKGGAKGKAKGFDKEEGKAGAKEKTRSSDKEEGKGVVKRTGKGSDKEKDGGAAKDKAKGTDKEKDGNLAKEKAKGAEKSKKDDEKPGAEKARTTSKKEDSKGLKSHSVPSLKQKEQTRGDKLQKQDDDKKSKVNRELDAITKGLEKNAFVLVDESRSIAKFVDLAKTDVEVEHIKQSNRENIKKHREKKELEFESAVREATIALEKHRIPQNSTNLKQLQLLPGLYYDESKIEITTSNIVIRMPSYDDYRLITGVKTKALQRRPSYSNLEPAVKPKSDISSKDEKIDRHRYSFFDENEMIVSKKIVRRRSYDSKRPQEALLFHTNLSISSIDIPEQELESEPPSAALGKLKRKRTEKPIDTSGVVCYELSDPSFIDKGWTLLPVLKVLRKVNIYRMVPSRPEFNWFERNKKKRIVRYETGENLAYFNENGGCHWYYRNRRLALDYYDTEDVNARKRFVIYSNGEPDECGRSRPITILASFDYVGNGVVFDHAGKIRLKYNQCDGIVLDRAIGPLSHWKWNDFNDPPVLQQVMIDTHLRFKDPDILRLGLNKEPYFEKEDNDDMLEIEFENVLKEQRKKVSSKISQSFPINMKALKINEYFSLRILDQAHIYLTFRDGPTQIKINLGMILDRSEIIDTDTAELGEISNPIERMPAQTDSVAALQRGLTRAQNIAKYTHERNERIRPTMPVASVDKLKSGQSRPLRKPLITLTPSSSKSNSRKPSHTNLYYNTRL